MKGMLSPGPRGEALDSKSTEHTNLSCSRCFSVPRNRRVIIFNPIYQGKGGVFHQRSADVFLCVNAPTNAPLNCRLMRLCLACARRSRSITGTFFLGGKMHRTTASNLAELCLLASSINLCSRLACHSISDANGKKGQ